MSQPLDLPGVIVHRDGFDPDDTRPWTPFPDGAAYLRQRHHDLIDACVAWAMSEGRDLDPDVVAVLCGAAEEGFNGGDVTKWTVERIYHMLCCHIPNWCDDHHAEVPDDVFKEPLWLLISFLAATDRLDDDSDPPQLLLQVLRCHGVDADGFESDDEADWHHEDAPFEYDGPATASSSDGAAHDAAFDYPRLRPTETVPRFTVEGVVDISSDIDDGWAIGWSRRSNNGSTNSRQSSSVQLRSTSTGWRHRVPPCACQSRDRSIADCSSFDSISSDKRFASRTTSRQHGASSC